MSRSPETTHRIMSAIPSKNTKPEIILRKALWSRGMRYRVNVARMKGKPDIVFTRARLVVFCDGDFWHGHNWALRGLGSLEEELAQYNTFWREKIEGNICRDRKTDEVLENSGWRVLRLWESDILKDTEHCCGIVISAYNDQIRSLSFMKIQSE